MVALEFPCIAFMANIPLNFSPALLTNNLSALQNALSYCAVDQTCLVTLKSEEVRTLADGDTIGQGVGRAQLHQIALVQLFGAANAVLAVGNSLQIWNIDLQELLLDWTSPEAAAKGTLPSLTHRGIAIATAADGACLLCIGSSNGTMHIFTVHAADQVRHSHALVHHQAAIAALASNIDSESHTISTSYLASCDDDGCINLFEATSASRFELRHRWEGHGVPCVAVGIMNDTLVGGFYDGSIRLYSLADGQLKAEVQAHSRFLSALAVHPTRPLFASAAEDATFAVWSMADAQQVHTLMSGCWSNTMITGVAFAGCTYDKIALAGYDTDEINVLSLE